MIIAGNKIYDTCPDCCKLVQINKAIFGSLHICLTPEERIVKNWHKYIKDQQINYDKGSISKEIK